MIDNKAIILQIKRGMAILRSLNDLEEDDETKSLVYHVKLFEGQKFYDEKELDKLETKVRNWQEETETCLIVMGIEIGENNPFRSQLIGIDRRGELARDIQYGLRYLNDIMDEESCFASEDILKNKIKVVVDDKAFNAKTGLPCFTNKQMGIFLRAIAELTEAPNPPAKTTLGEVVEKIAGYKATTVNQNMKGATSESDKEIVAKAIESKLPNLAAKVKKL